MLCFYIRYKSLSPYHYEENLLSLFFKHELKENINHLRRDWQTTRNTLLKLNLTEKKHQVYFAIKDFSISHWNSYIESLSAADKTVWSTTAHIRNTRKFIRDLNGPNGITYPNTDKAELKYWQSLKPAYN